MNGSGWTVAGIAVLIFGVIRLASGGCGGGTDTAVSVPELSVPPAITQTQTTPDLSNPEPDEGELDRSGQRDLDQAITDYQEAIKKKSRQIRDCGASDTTVEASSCLLVYARSSTGFSIEGRHLSEAVAEIGTGLPDSQCKNKLARLITSPTSLSLALLEVFDAADSVDEAGSDSYGIGAPDQAAISEALAPFKSAQSRFNKVATSAVRACSGGLIIRPGGFS